MKERILPNQIARMRGNAPPTTHSDSPKPPPIPTGKPPLDYQPAFVPRPNIRVSSWKSRIRPEITATILTVIWGILLSVNMGLGIFSEPRFSSNSISYIVARSALLIPPLVIAICGIMIRSIARKIVPVVLLALTAQITISLYWMVSSDSGNAMMVISVLSALISIVIALLDFSVYYEAKPNRM